MFGHKKDPSPEFLSFAGAQLEILPSPTGGEGPTTPGVEQIQDRVEIFDFGEGSYTDIGLVFFTPKIYHGQLCYTVYN